MVASSFLITLASWLLRPISWLNLKLYDFGLKKRKTPPILTVSVGNIAFGGTGKTPCALFLLSFFREQGWRPCYISRGYQGLWEKKGGIVADGHQLLATWQEAGDEPIMVAKRFPDVPVIVGQNRLASCLVGHQLGCQVAVLDDAFQHFPLERHLDIVLLRPDDRAQREGWSALRRADIILIQGNKDRLPPAARKALRNIKREPILLAYDLQPTSIYFPYDHRTYPSQEIMGKKVVAFCGVARPANFRQSLEQLKASLINFLAFPDHYAYPESALKRILYIFEKSQADWLITTEKDAVKIIDQSWFIKDLPLGILKIDFVPEANFIHALVDFLERNRSFKNLRN